MKKLLVHIILFLALLGMLSYGMDYGISKALRKSNHTLFKVWNDVQEGKVNSEIVIYGSSRARKQLNPRVMENELGYSTYNVGLDGQTIILQKALQDILLKHIPKPKLILFVVDQFTIAQDSMMFNSDQVLPYFQLPEIKKAISYYGNFNFFDKYFPLVRFAGRRDVLYEGAKVLLGNSKASQKEYKGFTFNEGRIVVKGDSAAVTNDSIQVSKKLIPLFEKLIDDLQANGIKIIFIVPPMHHEHYNAYLFHDDFIRFLQSEANTMHIPVLNYHKHPITLVDSLFMDPQHVNLEGATVFTKIVAEDVKKIFPTL